MAKQTTSKPATSSIAAIATAAPVAAPVAAKPTPSTCTVNIAGTKQPVQVLTVTAATCKPYGVKAGHNGTWFVLLQTLQAKQPSITVTQAVQAGVPLHFVGYCLRSGWAQPVTA